MECRKCHISGPKCHVFQEYLDGKINYVCIDLVECNKRANINFIKNGTKYDILHQLSINPNLIETIVLLGINNEEYNTIAVSRKGSSIKYITNPSPAIQKLAIFQDPINYYHIKKEHVCPVLELIVFCKFPDLIKYKKEPGIAIQLAVFYKNYHSVLQFKKVHNYITKISKVLCPEIEYRKIHEKYTEKYGYNEPFTLFRKWDYNYCVAEDTDSEFSLSDLN